MNRIYISTILFFLLSQYAICQTFTNDDYKKACWMTTRMYGGQRSGEGPNWLIMDHAVSSSDQSTLSAKGFSSSAYQVGKDFTNDADGSHSLSGGWVDCGDHVKFGQTEFYSAYTLLKGFDAFPEGYDDYYSYDYSGYAAAGDYSWESAKGLPNGIPDILDELHYACEFFIKCAKDGSTFYSQVGNGDYDHKSWVTSVAMAALSNSEGGQANGSRDFTKNPNDASMPSFCAATLALMSRVYRKYDPDFADECLTHAVYAYTYAKSKLGNTQASGTFYPANAHSYDDFVSACAELYWATGTASYKNEAISNAGNVKNHYYCYCYNNNDDVAAYNLAKLGNDTGLSLLEGFVSSYKGNVSSGLYGGGDAAWGPMRYNANAAFVVALYGALNNSTTVDDFIYNQIDFIMGSNSSNFSYITGFAPSGKTAATHPHHRNVYQSDDINASQSTLAIPTKNKQHGYLIGGSRTPSTAMAAGTEEYTLTEGGIDYNAGLVGALAYIVSRISPIDTTKFGHPTPELGEEQTLCGTGSATITATVDLSNLESGETVTYKWYKDDVLMSANNGKTSITVTSAGTYKCELVETSGNDWSTSGKVVVSATLPDIDLGDDIELCKVSSAVFSTSVSGDGINYAWTKDGNSISGATTNSYTAYSAGTYKLTVSASGCSSKSDEVTVTSLLPEVVGDTICTAGTAELSVITSGEYEWYTVAEEGSAVASGSSYSPSISSSKTYYVQDASSMNFTAGPQSSSFSGTAVNWGEISANFTTYAAMQITSIDVYIQSVYSQGSQTFTATLGGDESGTYTTTATLSSAGYITVSFESNPITISKAGNYTLKVIPSNGATGFFEKGSNYNTYQGNTDVITFTGASNGTASNYPFPGLCNWIISSGSSCVRTPVFAVLDPNADCGGDTESPTTPGTITISNITSNSATATWTMSTDNTAVTGYEIYLNGTSYKTVSTNSISFTELTANTEYTIKVRAYDEAGNYSEFNTVKTFTTSQATTTQTISLSSGWNLISFYVLPDDASVGNVFGSNLSKLDIIKNNDGFYKYGKVDDLQSLTELKLGEAYLVKMNSALNLSVEGIIPTSTSISLSKGWNLMGYPKATSGTLTTELNSIWSKVQTIKDFDNYKDQTSGTLNTLTPGSGYYIYMNSASTITFE